MGKAMRDDSLRTLVRDVLGSCAFPRDNDGHTGFTVSTDGQSVTIGAGHAWIDGLLCENEADIDAEAQPDLPDARIPTTMGAFVAYLDVWQRAVTAAERSVTCGSPQRTGPTRRPASRRSGRSAGSGSRTTQTGTTTERRPRFVRVTRHDRRPAGGPRPVRRAREPGLSGRGPRWRSTDERRRSSGRATTARPSFPSDRGRLASSASIRPTSPRSARATSSRWSIARPS